jgi:HPt (histidine-containing phosphotransfer) domain-containing protein
MLKNFLSALPPLRKSAKTETTVPTVDISRVIRQAVPQPRPEPFAALPSEELASLAEDAVDSLSGQFETWMRTDLDQLISAWQLAQKPGATAENYRAVFTAAHNIKGAANSYGYPAVARLCGSLSRLLTQTRPGENSALINLHVEACRAAFTSIGQGSDGQTIADAVCEALEERVAVKLASA